MTDTSDLPPGIYAFKERRLSDDQLLAIARLVKSIPAIWVRFSKIRPHEWIDDKLAKEVRSVMREYVVSNNLIMSGADTNATFMLLREMARKGQLN